MSLAQLHDQMAWPLPTHVRTPSGVGPRLLADLAREKIQKAIARRLGTGRAVQVGLLLKNPHTNATEAPIALVCEFARVVDPQILALSHRLAWNFARAPLLVTIEPHQVRTWTCCEPPLERPMLLDMPAGEIEAASLDLIASLTASERAAHALHWVRLVAGDFYRQFPDRFPRDGRADRILLDEFTAVRRRLQRQGLADDRIHDLLARVVFIQFLFDRKDANGRAALNPSLLGWLHKEGLLNREHASLESILADHDEAYRFFRWLNGKFNGDLFPGKGRTQREQAQEWRGEMEQVEPKHLQTLADFVGGRFRGRQRVFWRQYSFDVIPLEFISSIYEEFVTTGDAYSTPGFLADFMLDGVLPWDSDEWDLSILDPACGSGIFLVKAYQRLIQRWKNAHGGEKVPTPVLKRLLERNLFGVDINAHAVRVASFSLYLTMCDEIDPKTYLRTTKFPRLRERRLIHADFFQENLQGFSSRRRAPTYDLVVGNAPWGRNTETDHARTWASQRSWAIANKAIGTLFLAKAASLTQPEGRICMIQPASSLLFNRSGPASRFRQKFFSEFKVDEVVNLSTLRFELFENATSPPCIVTLRPMEPDGQPIVYISPKQVKATAQRHVAESKYSVIIEPHDISRIWPEEAASEALVWTALAWAGRRDFALIKRLAKYDTLQKLMRSGIVKSREGMIRGDRKQVQNEIVGRPILEGDDFPDGTFLRLDATDLPLNEDPHTHSRDSTSYEAFDPPQVVIKQGWTTETGRFKAALHEGPEEGAICSQSYISVHAAEQLAQVLESAVLSYNSMLAVYFLLLTSGRLASYRPEPLVEEMRSVPFAKPRKGMLHGLRTFANVDERVHEELALKDAERVLIDDLFRYTMPDFKGDESSPGRKATPRGSESECVSNTEPELSAYCEYFIRVLKAGFGQEKPICGTIFQDPLETRLPLRLVAIHLERQRGKDISVERIDSARLCSRLLELDEKLLKAGDAEDGGVFFRRVARVYDEFEYRGRATPTIYIVKPDQIRYWTRSAALRDADEVSADILLWRESAPAAVKPGAGWK